MIELGKEGKDRITGFVGIVTARHTYITGCDQYTLTPKKNEDGDIKDQYSFDEGRVEVIGDGILVATVQTKVKGGPQRISKPSK